MFTRASLRETGGPAIVEDAESTIVVPPGWRAVLAEDMAVILTRTDTDVETDTDASTSASAETGTGKGAEADTGTDTGAGTGIA
nr:hypothetical protein GCM10020093_110220 [Planobispora longispora]